MLNDEVRSIMTKDAFVANPSQLLSELSDQMISQSVQELPVVEKGKLVGMLTSHDLWKAEHALASNPLRTVRDVMNKTVIKLMPKDKLGTAAELFMDRRFKTLPVVNLRNELKGVVTAFDVIKAVMKKEYPHPILYADVINKA